VLIGDERSPGLPQFVQGTLIGDLDFGWLTGEPAVRVLDGRV
jgi:hypothetical protein